MAFNITLYNCDDDPKMIDKTLGTAIATVSCTPTEGCDVLTPTFILDYKESYLSANYCYCPLFKRYYFINDIKIDIGKKISITCGVDVLYTYRQSIRNATCVVTRSEFPSSGQEITWVPDDKYPTISRKTLQSYLMASEPFTGVEKVLWEVYDGIPSQPSTISLTIGQYFYNQKWKYQLTGTADAPRANYIEESLPGPDDTRLYNGAIVSIGNYRYKIKTLTEERVIIFSPYGA